MAHRKSSPDSLSRKHEIARCIRRVRMEQFSARGGPELARHLGIPRQSLDDYELGVTVPAEVVLKLLEDAAVEPRWLLTGEGSPYRDQPAEASGPAPTPVPLMGWQEDALARLLEEGEPRVRWVRRVDRSSG